jgi:hypothetical protein
MPEAVADTQALVDGGWFDGPRVVVLVDDYDMLTAAGQQPPAPFLPYVPSARDIGLHFVVARRVAAHLGLDHALDAPVPLARPLGAQDRPAVPPRRRHHPGRLGPPGRDPPARRRDLARRSTLHASGDPGLASRRPDWVWRTKLALSQASGMVVAST